MEEMTESTGVSCAVRVTNIVDKSGHGFQLNDLLVTFARLTSDFFFSGL